MHMVLRFHKISRWFFQKKLNLISNLIYKLIRIIFSCDLKYTIKIGDNVNFYHNGLGVVIHPNSEIGEGSSIYQNVTLGGNGKSTSKDNFPIIGKNVTISAGAIILGPIHIGDNSIIGANSVITNDVPPNSTVVGVPGKIINK